MKKFFIIAAIFLSGFFASSAQSLQGSFEKELPDSVKYYIPEFENGRVIYKDGQFATGKFNISTLDQTLRYIDANGKVMGITDNSSIDRVQIGKMMFIRHQNYYLALALNVDDVYLCASRRLVFADSKKGAFGMESSTTNIKEAKKVEGTGGMIYDLNGKPSYTVKNIPYLYRKNVAYAPTKKLLLRFFKDKSEQINAYLDNHRVNFSDFDQVYDLLAAIND